MKTTTRLTSMLALGLGACVLLPACGDDSPGDTGGDEAGTTDTGTGDDTTSGEDEVGTTMGDTTADTGTGESSSDTDTGPMDTGSMETDTGAMETDTGAMETDTGVMDTGTDTDTGGMGICGNGILEAGEDCDDNNNENNDGCLADCTFASCGDGFVNEGVEVCDDGVNDGAYGGCEVGCESLAAYCGDGEINGPESCDDANLDLADGCLDNCEIPESCLTLLEYDDMLEDGAYMIAPPGYNGEPFEVYCDMVSDGGGYTFLKINPNADTFAVAAETECAMWGMQLWIPRSVDHKTAGYTIATDANIGPDGSDQYMRILGIYPEFNGGSCASQPMNSGNLNCQWHASDDGPWYVHDVNNITEPNGDNNVIGSMYYDWNGNGDIVWHNDIPGDGYSSTRFMCDIGDKLP